MSHAADRFANSATTLMNERGGFRSHDPAVDGPSAHGIGLGLLSVWIGGPVDTAMLRGLEREAAARILHGMVWQPLGAAHFAPGLDHALLAYALEAGTSQALTDLQAELGVPPSGGPDEATVAAARQRDPRRLAAALLDAWAAWRSQRGLPSLPAGTRQRSPEALCTA